MSSPWRQRTFARDRPGTAIARVMKIEHGLGAVSGFEALLERARRRENPRDLRTWRRALRGTSSFTRGRPSEVWLVTDRGQPVAGAVSTIQPAAGGPGPDVVATVGFLAVAEGSGAAPVLLRAAADWAATAGADRIRGPVNGDFFAGFGLPEGPADETPTVGNLGADGTTPEDWQAAGFHRARSFTTWRIDLGAAPRETEPPPGLLVRPASRLRWMRDVGAFAELHTECFAGMWGETPVDPARAAEMMGDGRWVCDTGLFLFAEEAGRTAGVVFTTPDYNVAFAREGCDADGFRAARALWRHRSAIERAALHTVAVRPEWRGRGVARALVSRIVERVRSRGYRELDYCLVDDENEPSRALARSFGGRPHRRRAVWERGLGRMGKLAGSGSYGIGAADGG